MQKNKLKGKQFQIYQKLKYKIWLDCIQLKKKLKVVKTKLSLSEHFSK